MKAKLVRARLNSIQESYPGHKKAMLSELDKIEEIASKQKPIKAIKTETSSQACPICKYDVNWKYCSNCAQAIEY